MENDTNARQINSTKGKQTIEKLLQENNEETTVCVKKSEVARVA